MRRSSPSTSASSGAVPNRPDPRRHLCLLSSRAVRQAEPATPFANRSGLGEVASRRLLLLLLIPGTDKPLGYHDRLANLTIEANLRRSTQPGFLARRLVSMDVVPPLFEQMA